MHNKAIEYYQIAGKMLGTREAYPEVWDMVMQELAGAYLALAVLLQDTRVVPGYQGSEEDRDRQVVHLLNESLKLLEALVKHSSSVDVRALLLKIADIHHRLGRVHLTALQTHRVHNHPDLIVKVTFQYLDKALRGYSALSGVDPRLPLGVLIDLLSFIAPKEGQVNSLGSAHEHALLRIVACAKIIKSAAANDAVDHADVIRIVTNIESGLLYTLRELMKAQSTSAKDKSAAVKACYETALLGLKPTVAIINRCRVLADCLDRIAALIADIKGFGLDVAKFG